MAKKNTSKTYFVGTFETLAAINGRYGLYAKSGRVNLSEKFLLSHGYELRELTDSEYNAVVAEQSQRIADLRKQEREQEMAFRAKQVELCLASAPLAIGEGNALWQSVTSLEGGHLEAYTGCCDGTAYVSDAKIIAWHRGNEAPVNAPKDATVIRVVLSGCQILY